MLRPAASKPVHPDRTEAAMPWTWRYLDAGGEPVAPGSSEGFPTQSDAESWLGESWRDLLEAGVERVTLREDGRDDYTMGLSPAT